MLLTCQILFHLQSQGLTTRLQRVGIGVEPTGENVFGCFSTHTLYGVATHLPSHYTQRHFLTYDCPALA